jgi:prolyl oligopeptidase
LRPTLVYAPGPREAFVEARATRGNLLVTTLDNVKGRAYVYTPQPGGRWSRRALALPDNAAIDIVNTDRHSDRAFLSVTGFLAPITLWLADLKSGALTTVKTLPRTLRRVAQRGGAARSDVHRRTRFRISWCGPVDMKRDGTTPTIVNAYGGFLSAETPYYSPDTGKLWLERGGAFVLANIRGGGEFGPAWHAQGSRAPAAHLRRLCRGREGPRRQTHHEPRHLGIMGGSNGGLLMGVEMIQHPELFGAADMQVPLLDMLRYEHIAAGSSWVGEYGSVSNPEERAFLASISPYHNVKPGVSYPEPLIWTTTKDDRVGPQHARKFAARLSAMGIPYLYYEVIQGGHGAGATLEEKAAMRAREFTYFARKLSLQ